MDKINTRYMLPSYRKSGNDTNYFITSGKFSGKTFKTRKDFEDFFLRDMAREQARSEKLGRKGSMYLKEERRRQGLM